MFGFTQTKMESYYHDSNGNRWDSNGNKYEYDPDDDINSWGYPEDE